MVGCPGHLGAHSSQRFVMNDGPSGPHPDFEAFFESAPGLLCLVLDPEWKILAATDTYLQATLTVRDEIVGRYLFDVFPDNPDDPVEESGRNMRASLDRVAAGRAADVMPLAKHDVRDAGPDGGFEERYWSPTNTPVFADDGSLQYIMHRVENVTEFVQLHQRASVTAADGSVERMAAEIVNRRAEVAEASRHLKESNAALRAAQAEAQRANAAKDEFLSRMSHELRTPLNAVLGFAQLLELDALSPSQEEAVGHILRGGNHLLAMINDVLDIARIESDRLELSPEPVHIATLLTETIGLMTPAADANRIEILFDPAQPAADRYVRGDRRRLRQVLINLLSNGIKYNRPDGRIDIGVALADDTHLSMAVTDTGKGIAADDLPRLFRPFDRLGQQSSDIEGTGIGLALSQRLATVMGGRLDVASTPGRGSTFTVTMPLTDLSPTTHPASDTTRDVPAIGHGTVLYIEDNHSNIDLLTAVLRLRPGWTMIHAGTGGHGLELAATNVPTVILLDLHLPDIDGIDVLQTLRTDPTTSAIPVAILSADATPGQERRLLAAGAQKYLTKPIDVRELLAFLDAAP